MKKARVTIDAAIICDDIRREINNKRFLIGVWALELAVGAYPAEAGFLLHCEGAVLKSGEMRPRLRVMDDIGSILYDSDVSDKGEVGQFIIGRYGVDFDVLLQLTRSCNLHFLVTLADEEILACTRRVELFDVLRKEREQQFKELEEGDSSDEK